MKKLSANVRCLIRNMRKTRGQLRQSSAGMHSKGNYLSKYFIAAQKFALHFRKFWKLLQKLVYIPAVNLHRNQLELTSEEVVSFVSMMGGFIRTLALICLLLATSLAGKILYCLFLLLLLIFSNFHTSTT